MAHSITLQTGEATVVDGDVLGRLGFAASAETGAEALKIAAKIEAIAEETFDASNNATEMVFYLAADGAAAAKMTLSSGGNLTLGGDLYADKIRRASDSSTTTKILLNDEALKLYAGHSSNNICTIDSTGLTIDNGSLETATIDYTDGDLAMTIADGGKVTFAAGFAVGSDAAGDILYHNGTSYIRLAIGSDGQVLTVNDSANGVGWEAGGGGGSTAADDIGTGDAAVTITTSTGNITIDAAANDSDIIFKGTDNTSDITMLTLDGSEAGAATFNSTVTATGFTIGSAAITEAELEILDGATVTTAELNILDGVTSTAAELNILDGVTSTAAELNILDGVTSTAAELNILDGVTATATELNYLDITTLGTAENSKAFTRKGDATATFAGTTIADLGTVTTADINGGTIDGATIGGSSAGAGTFTSLDCTDGGFAIANLDIDGGTDIGEALVGADLIIVDNGAGGTNRKSTMTRVATFVLAQTASSVDIDGGAIDGTVIGANSAAAGTFAAIVGSSLSLGEGNITNVGDINCDSVSVDAAAVGLNIAFGGNTTLNKMTLTDNLADALNITEGSNSYIKFVTTDSAEKIVLGKSLVGATHTDGSGQDASLAIDCSKGNYQEILLGNADVTSVAFTNATAGQRIVVRFKNHSTAKDLHATAGWNSVTINGSSATLHWPGGTEPTLTDSNNAIDVYGFVFTSTVTTAYGFIMGQDIKA